MQKYVLISITDACDLGCERCGYNWYKRNWNNGNPTKYFRNTDCGCCGGSKAQKEVCKEVCGRKTPGKNISTSYNMQ